MHFILFWAVAMLQPQPQAADVPAIVVAALDRVIPATLPAPQSLAIVPLRGRALFLDTARTTESFRNVEPGVTADYRRVNRQFLARTHGQAVQCNAVKKQECSVVDDGVYAAITSVKRDQASAGYEVNLLVYWSGRPFLQGIEQEMLVTLQPGGGWHVEKLGRLRVIN